MWWKRNVALTQQIPLGIRNNKMFAKGSINNYKTAELLGSGDCGDVWKATDQTTGQKVALKLFKREVQVATYDVEVSALRAVSHPRVVRLLAHGESEEYKSDSGELSCVSFIAMELAANGELYSYVKKATEAQKTEALSERVTRAYVKQLLEALAACHRAGVAHRDLKLDNFLLDADFQLVLTDFGLAATDNIGNLLGYEGKTISRAPEILRGDVYDGTKTDVFACGVAAFSLRTGSIPFRQAAPTDVYYNTLKTDPAKYWRLQSKAFKNPSLFSQDFCDFLQKLMAHDPKQRLSVEEALAHPWLQGETATTLELRREIQQWQ